MNEAKVSQYEAERVIWTESMKVVAKHYAEKIQKQNLGWSEAQVAAAVVKNWSRIEGQIEMLAKKSLALIQEQVSA